LSGVRFSGRASQIDSAAARELAPSQAAQIVTALGGVAKIIEATELLKRTGRGSMGNLFA